MQFKKVGRRTQVLAYRGYDKERKRAIVKMLGSYDSYNFSMSDGLSDSLTADELTELQSHIETVRQADAERDRQSSANYLSHSINRVADSLTAEAVSLSDEKASDMWAAMDSLAKALRKAGHKKPTTPKAPPAADENQPQLV